MSGGPPVPRHTVYFCRPYNTTMTKVRDFVVGLNRAGRRFAEIKTTVDAAVRDHASIYFIMKKVKAGKKH
jgi:hypothetical protein